MPWMAGKECPMDQNKYDVIGKNVRRKDVLDKVLGKAKFAADYDMEGMLYGGVFRSTVPHGLIRNLDVSEARNMTGVACVLTYKDIPGKNRFGIIIKDEPSLVEDKVRRIGDAIALVAAESEEILEKALAKIQVEIDPLESIFTMERALAEDAPRIHGTTNIHIQKKLRYGDAEQAFKHCNVIVENTYKTPSLSHMFIEPEAGVSYWEKGIMTVPLTSHARAGSSLVISTVP